MGKGQAAASRKTTEEDETTAQGTNTQDNESNTQTKHTHINMLATRRAAPTLARSLKSLSRLVRTPTYDSAPPQLNPLVNLLVTIGAPDSTGRLHCRCRRLQVPSQPVASAAARSSTATTTAQHPRCRAHTLRRVARLLRSTRWQMMCCSSSTTQKKKKKRGSWTGLGWAGLGWAAAAPIQFAKYSPARRPAATHTIDQEQDTAAESQREECQKTNWVLRFPEKHGKTREHPT